MARAKNSDIQFEKGEYLAVEWLDADVEDGWVDHDPDGDGEGKTMTSVGVFVSQGPKFITLSFCHNKEADQWLAKHRIPLAWISSIKRLTTEG